MYYTILIVEIMLFWLLINEGGSCRCTYHVNRSTLITSKHQVVVFDMQGLVQIMLAFHQFYINH